jgi:phospholipid/cholesterol/gamma-HCH transport system substrate-binding protein
VSPLIIAFVLYVMYARGVFEPTQQLVLVTENSEGVIPGMDMTFAGFPIGRVRLVDLAKDGKVRSWSTSRGPTPSGCAPRASSRSSAAWSAKPACAPSPASSTTRRCRTARAPVLRGDVTAEIPGLVATARSLLNNLESMTRKDRAISRQPGQRRRP